MRLVFDIETNGIDFSTGDFIDQVTDVWCIVAKDIDTGKRYSSTPLDEKGKYIPAGIISILENADELIGHNIIQFDIPVLRSKFGFSPRGTITDTLVISRTLYPDRPGRHSLEAWGDRLGDGKGSPGSFDSFSDELLEYCRQDVRLTERVYQVLQEEQEGHDWDKALKLEHEVAKIIAEQEAIGFRFKKQEAEKLIQEWNNAITTIDTSIHSAIGSRRTPSVHVSKPFKINGEYTKRTLDVASKYGIDSATIVGPFSTLSYGSYELESKDQQKKILLDLGWKPEQLTEKGNPKLDDSIKKVGPVGKMLSERNVLSHRRSQVAGLVKNTDSYGRIHGGANPCGTNTARMTHQRIVNIPRTTTKFGHEMRSLFTVPVTKKLLGYDAAGLELRVLAHYIGDESYVRTVCNTDKEQDAHTLAASAAGSTDRDTGKTINYALIYGAGDYKLGTIVGKGKQKGAQIRQALYREIPGFQKLVRSVDASARRGYLLSLDDRKLFLRTGKSPLNTLIQGGGAIFMKTVASILKELTPKLSAFKVIDMHDEAQWECPPAEVETLTELIHTAFARATESLELRCPMEAQIKVGTTWSQTH